MGWSAQSRGAPWATGWRRVLRLGSGNLVREEAAQHTNRYIAYNSTSLHHVVTGGGDDGSASCRPHYIHYGYYVQHNSRIKASSVEVQCPVSVSVTRSRWGGGREGAKRWPATVDRTESDCGQANSLTATHGSVPARSLVSVAPPPLACHTTRDGGSQT